MDLNSNITNLPKIGPIFARKFEKLGIHTINDLFYHVPSRYLDYSLITTISNLKAGEIATIHAKVISIKNIISKRGLKMQIASVEDATGKISTMWFNQPFLTRTLFPGKLLSLSGKVGFFNRKLCLNSPDFEIIENDTDSTLHTGRLVPVYPETSGFSSKWIRRVMLNSLNDKSLIINDFLSMELLKKLEMTNLIDAIRLVHFPKSLEEAEIGRKRLAFNELLKLQLTSLYRKKMWQKEKLIQTIKIDRQKIDKFINSLPFKLTDSQETAINEILMDMGKKIPMNRLLEGDVGSGKTVVAATAALAVFTNGGQTVIMAPTQILAEQHYKTLTKLFDQYKLNISLITSATKKSKSIKADIYIGTHALLHKKIDFTKVGLVVIDEQHRFGVEQRNHLIQKTNKNSSAPHVLTMTATPIPRTIALTSYGDLDLSVLKEVPKGRQKITTWVVPEEKRKGAYEWVKKQIDGKSQIFWVCPLIEASETETMKDIKNVTQEFENLKRIFAKQKLGLLHGRMKAGEKTETLKFFRAGKIDILVATPVVEVGIDIPNATIMVIEASERFGLAGLHQLRGRVGRGNKKSYCLLFSNIKFSKRLKAMEKTNSGFELAELDLKLRGPGEIFGTLQSGFPELKVARWDNIELIKTAKDVAEDVINNPSSYKDLAASLTKFQQG